VGPCGLDLLPEGFLGPEKRLERHRARDFGRLECALRREQGKNAESRSRLRTVDERESRLGCKRKRLDASLGEERGDREVLAATRAERA